MRQSRDNKPRRIVDPRGHRIPLFVRLCEAFVDNLTQILRVALVAGGIYLTHSLLDLRDAMEPVELAPGPAPIVEAIAEPPVEDEGVLDSDVIQLAEECTRAEYWKRHYDKCFPDGSAIYPRPSAEELDDAGFLMDESAVLLASLNPH